MTMKRIQVYGLTSKEYAELEIQAENLGLKSISEYAKLVLSQMLSEKKYPMDYFGVACTVPLELEESGLQRANANAGSNPNFAKSKVVEIKESTSSQDNETQAHWIKPSLKLNAVEAAILKEAADQADMSVSSFIRLALRSQLTKSAIFNNEEIKALFQSNYQLRRIGQNLNQIAHAVNAMQATEITTKVITDLENAINAHVAHVNAVIQANQEKLA